MVNYDTSLIAKYFFGKNMFTSIFINGSFQTSLIGLSLISNLLIATPSAQPAHVLGSHEFSLGKRYPDKWVSDVFKDNILLNIAYMRGIVHNSNIDWNEIEKPFHYEFKLEKDQVFAFHDDVLPEYQGKVAVSTHAHFNSGEGFKSDGWLIGDGVCHLASIINWAARDAGLEVLSPTNHNFAAINQIPREYGVAIYNVPGQSYSNEVQNLYIRNNKDKPISLVFDYDGENLKVSVVEN